MNVNVDSKIREKSATEIAGWHKRHGRRLPWAPALPRTMALTRVPTACKFGADVAHGDRLVDGRCQQAAGDFANALAAGVLQFGVFAHGNAL